MSKILTLKFDSTCIDCGREICAGERGRWIGRGRITCVPGDAEGCKADSQPAPDKPVAGSTYRLTGPSGTAAISNGSSWADSKVPSPSPSPFKGNGQPNPLYSASPSKPARAAATDDGQFVHQTTTTLLAMLAGIAAELLKREVEKAD